MWLDRTEPSPPALRARLPSRRAVVRLGRTEPSVALRARLPSGRAVMWPDWTEPSPAALWAKLPSEL